MRNCQQRRPLGASAGWLRYHRSPTRVSAVLLVSLFETPVKFSDAVASAQKRGPCCLSYGETMKKHASGPSPRLPFLATIFQAKKPLFSAQISITEKPRRLRTVSPPNQKLHSALLMGFRVLAGRSDPPPVNSSSGRHLMLAFKRD